MDDDNVKELAVMIATILDERHKDLYCPLDPKRREQDHEWVKLKRKGEEQRIKFYSDLTLHMAKWGMVSLASVIFYALWLGIKNGFLK